MCRCGAFRKTDDNAYPLQVRQADVNASADGFVRWVPINRSKVERNQTYTKGSKSVFEYYQQKCPECGAKVQLWSHPKNVTCAHMKIVETQNELPVIEFCGSCTQSIPVRLPVADLLSYNVPGIKPSSLFGHAHVTDELRRRAFGDLMVAQQKLLQTLSACWPSVVHFQGTSGN